MENYEAFYRKYRPKDWSEVIGQEKALTLLQKVVNDKKPAHAYLFTGGRGIGKTSLARIFAKSLAISPLDIVELDAASNRGIDEIRALKESIYSLPLSSKYKMYILDEAHMLTKEAANALLKTLEEPPSHVMFVLATTEKEKLPDTILSRCQLVTLYEPSVEMLADHLSAISNKESKTLTKDAAFLIAKEGRGSFRDALGILEKIIRSGKENILDEVFVRDMLGISERGAVSLAVTALYQEDYVSLQNILNDLKKKNISAELFFEDMIDFLRKLLLFRINALLKTDLMYQEVIEVKQNIKKEVQSKQIIFFLEKKPLLKMYSDKSFDILFLLAVEMNTL